MKSEKITKVKFRDGGLGGMVVFFERPSKRSNENFRDDYKVTYKAPVHKDLLAYKEKLTAHLKDICRLSDDVDDDDIRLTEISSNAYDQFVLIGKLRSYGSTECPLKTANIQEATGYGKFLDVIETVGDLYDEIRCYIRAEKQVDLVQIALDFASKDKKVDMDEIAGMSPEQKAEYCRTYLEEKGCIVIPTGDSDDENYGEQDLDADSGNESESQHEVEEGANLSELGGEQGDQTAQPMLEPGFGSSPTGKVVLLTQAEGVQDAYKDDIGHLRGKNKSRSLG